MAYRKPTESAKHGGGVNQSFSKGNQKNLREQKKHERRELHSVHPKRYTQSDET
jgi:hypothetical protein